MVILLFQQRILEVKRNYNAHIIGIRKKASLNILVFQTEHGWRGQSIVILSNADNPGCCLISRIQFKAYWNAEQTEK